MGNLDYSYALSSAANYNGLSEVIFSWRDLPSETVLNCCGYQARLPNTILRPDNYNAPEDWSNTAVGQLQIYWETAVILFGDYGTSPRRGWIEKVDEFKEWVLEITKSWRGSFDYSGPEEFRYDWSTEEA